MTAERQETVADVVRVMRNETFRRNGKRSLDVERYMHLYADRIEAAHKREQDAHNAFLTGVAQGIIDEKKKHDAEMRRVGQVVVVNDIPTDNSTKTQKDGVLSCGADGAAPEGQGQGNWEHVGKLPWIVDYCWDIRDANGYVIAKVNENLSEEAYKRMCEFIAAAANATAGPLQRRQVAHGPGKDGDVGERGGMRVLRRRPGADGEGCPEGAAAQLRQVRSGMGGNGRIP